MTRNEIKKKLYQEKPVALAYDENGEDKRYAAAFEDRLTVYFKVPFSDMGEKVFDDEMPAQLLIRWLL